MKTLRWRGVSLVVKSQNFYFSPYPMLRSKRVVVEWLNFLRQEWGFTKVLKILTTFRNPTTFFEGRILYQAQGFSRFIGIILVRTAVVTLKLVVCLAVVFVERVCWSCPWQTLSSSSRYVGAAIVGVANVRLVVTLPTLWVQNKKELQRREWF